MKPDAAKLKQQLLAGVRIENPRLIEATAELSAPFNNLGFKADGAKAYIEFEICHSLPTVAGPVQSENMIGYFPQVLAQSHKSLLHQQFNIRHLIKGYDPKNIPRDRIIGAVVATHFPTPPAQGWLSPTNPKGATACIRACAVIFKLAEGVPKLLGEHMTSRQKQSVSIEVTTGLDNIGVWRPSTSELYPLLDCPDPWFEAMEQYGDGTGLPKVGSIEGERLAVIYGLPDSGRPVDFQGVGMTPRPAEPTAKIISVTCEGQDGGDVFAVTAESIDLALVGQKVTFPSTGRIGEIIAVTTGGEARAGLLRQQVTPGDPVATIRLPDGRRILRAVSALPKKSSE